MVKVAYNDQLVYKVFIGAFLGICLWKGKVALSCMVTKKFISFKNKVMVIKVHINIIAIHIHIYIYY